MRILATISDMKHIGFVLDLDAGEITYIPARPEFIDFSLVDRPPCRPFGITWSRDELFIANNKQLLVFDTALNYKGTSDNQLQINVHQLAYRSQRVWAVSPWTNSLVGVPTSLPSAPVEFDLIDGSLRPYHHREAYAEEDKCHFNSLLWDADMLFVAAHNFGPNSFINCYDTRRLCLESVRRHAGHSIHGLARQFGELFWISTMTGEVRSDCGYCIPLSRGGFARGFAMTSQYFIVATSEFLSRNERATGDSWIQLIDRDAGIAIKEIHVSDTGSINDLRLLDEFDYAHGIDPVWT